MRRIFALALALPGFVLLGCNREQAKVNVTAPGVNVQVDKGVDVKVPGVNVTVPK